MVVVVVMTVAIWSSSQLAPCATPCAIAPRMSPAPAPRIDDPIPSAAPQTALSPGIEEQPTAGTIGRAEITLGPCVDRAAGPRAPSRGRSMEPRSRSKEEIHEGGCRSDQQRGQPGYQDGPSPREGLVVVLRMSSERPCRRSDHHPNQRKDSSPTADPIDQLLECATAGQLGRIRVERDTRHHHGP